MREGVNTVMIDDCMLRQRCRKTRQEILKKHFPMRFARWYDDDHIRYTNCYGYVFNMWIVSEEDHRFSYLGWTEMEDNVCYTKEDAEKAFLLDMRNLGFKVRKINKAPKPKNNKINIAFFIGKTIDKANGDFHFARQNHDGTWSHKLGFEGKVERFVNMDGKTCLPHESDYEEIEFVGYYQVSIK